MPVISMGNLWGFWRAKIDHFEPLYTILAHLDHFEQTLFSKFKKMGNFTMIVKTLLLIWSFFPNSWMAQDGTSCNVNEKIHQTPSYNNTTHQLYFQYRAQITLGMRDIFIS